MKTKTFKVLSSALLLSSSLSAAAFEGDFAVGLVGQVSADAFLIDNSDVKIKFKNITESNAAQEALDAVKNPFEASTKNMNELVEAKKAKKNEDGTYEALTGDDAPTPQQATAIQEYNNGLKDTKEKIKELSEKLEKAAAPFEQKKLLSKDMDLLGGVGLKFLANLDDNLLLDVSLIGKKAFSEGDVKLGNNKVEFTNTEGFFKNMAFELNVGALFNVMDISEDAQLYAGGGVAVGYNMVDKTLKSKITHDGSDAEVIESTVKESEKFEKGKLSGGVYGTVQAMFKATDSVLAGVGVKLQATMSNSPFGNVDKVDSIEDPNLWAFSPSVFGFVTYVI